MTPRVTRRERGDEAMDLQFGIAAHHDGVVGITRRGVADRGASCDRGGIGMRQCRQRDRMRSRGSSAWMTIILSIISQIHEEAATIIVQFR